ncbi:hypothetical protein Dimus_025416 [Dionaea muscipula]
MAAKEESSDRERSEGWGSGEDLKSELLGDGGVTEYEKQRLRRIQENRERMEALGLHKQASSLMGSLRNRRRMEKRAQVKEEDEEYIPPCDEDQDDDDDDELGTSSSEESDYEGAKSAKTSRFRFGKMKSKKSTPRKKVQMHIDSSDFTDEDKALMQAIALSLEDSQQVSDVPYAGPSQKSNAQAINVPETIKDTGKRKKRKMVTKRVQMTDDDVIIHFCQFDAAGKGTITLRNLQQMASSHDFIWTDEDFANMIRCFDSDGDGKLSLDDFRNIVSRCGMLQGFD